MCHIDRYGEVVAQDGVHPNEIGYKVFAEYVGGELARIWKEQAEVAPPHQPLHPAPCTINPDVRRRIANGVGSLQRLW